MLRINVVISAQAIGVLKKYSPFSIKYESMHVWQNS